MDDEQIEYFHGNKREIDNEKLRKRELMSYFPKTFGTADKTRYVLLDDNGKKLKLLNDELQNDDEHGKDNPNFGKIVTNINFERCNKGAEFLNQVKDYIIKDVPIGSFAFAGSNIGANSHFYPLLQDLKTGNKSASQANSVVVHDSLNLRKGNASSDFIGTANDKSEINFNQKNDSVISKNNLRIYGSPRTKDYAIQLNDLKNRLPAKAIDILNQLGVNIEIIDNLFTINNKGKHKKIKGMYVAKNNCILIDSKHIDEYTLISEVFHAAQDYFGMTGSGRSNLEFQEHVIKDLYFNQRFFKTNNPEYLNGISTTDYGEYIKLIGTVFDENNVLDLKKFLPVVESYFDEFQKYYSPSGMYQEPGIENFDYNWIELLDLFGIEYK